MKNHRFSDLCEAKPTKCNNDFKPNILHFLQLISNKVGGCIL